MKRVIGLIFLCVTHLLNADYIVPRRNEPLGIVNMHGVCYAASVIQLLEALRFACPESMEAILKATDDPLLIGYRTAINDVSRFAGHFMMQLIDPRSFIAAWVQLAKQQYAHVLVERIVQPNGTIVDRELRPGSVDLGIGGGPGSLTALLLERMRKTDAQHQLRQELPHLVSFDTFECLITPENIQQGVQQCGSICERAFATLAADNMPRFVMISMRGKDSILNQPISLRIPLSVEHAGERYHLLAAIYTLPMFSVHLLDTFSQNYTYDAMHCITLVRYEDRWYECSNHTVTPFASENAVAEWIDVKARTSYHGAVLPDGVKAIFPRIILYERVTRDAHHAAQVQPQKPTALKRVVQIPYWFIDTLRHGVQLHPTASDSA